MAQTRYPPVPRVGAGAVVLHQNKVLLVLRGQPPAMNLWAIPGGTVNLGETLAQAARREVLEETGLAIETGKIVFTFEKIQRDAAGQVEYHYVVVDMLARPVDPLQPLRPADDALQAGWFTLAQAVKLPVAETTLTLLQQVMKDL
jgi:ADP-ribose pyrophosphatase